MVRNRHRQLWTVQPNRTQCRNLYPNLHLSRQQSCEGSDQINITIEPILKIPKIDLEFNCEIIEYKILSTSVIDSWDTSGDGVFYTKNNHTFYKLGEDDLNGSPVELKAVIKNDCSYHEVSKNDYL